MFVYLLNKSANKYLNDNFLSMLQAGIIALIEIQH